MNIVIVSPTRIEIDGQDAGFPFVVYLERPDLRDQITEAFSRWHAGNLAAEAERDREKNAQIAKVVAECNAKVAQMEADMAILGTKEEAQRMRREKEREDLKRRLAELEAMEKRGA